MDIAKAGEDGFSWERVLSLIEQLPSTARFWKAQYPEVQWTESEYLLANIFDAVNIANWQRANTGVKKTKQSKPPEPLDRPGKRKKKLEKINDLGKRLIEQRKRLS